MNRPLLAFAMCTLLAACAHGPSATTVNAPAAGRVGYVRMDELVRKHPLYGQLAQYDANIEALSLSAQVPQALAAGSTLKREQNALDAQLQAAAKRTNAVLLAKGRSYQDRENAAIAAALRSSGASGGGPSVSQIEGSLAGTARSQAAGNASQAQGDLNAYRKVLEAQDAAQITAAEHTLTARADRTYRAKADALNAQEAALSLQLANADAAERLSLRTKLSSLALEDAAREAATNRIAALDRKEADALDAVHGRDVQTLADLQKQLRAQVQSDLDKAVAQIHAQSVTRYRERGDQLHTQFGAPAGTLAAAAPNGGAPPSAAASPALKQRIQQLHADYQQAFERDARQTIADFNRTRAALTARYEQLASIDAAATQGAQSEIVTLQHKRESLYQEMVAQIEREVKTIAQERGVSVVVSTVAPAGGVDLTPDAMKDIETLHE